VVTFRFIVVTFRFIVVTFRFIVVTFRFSSWLRSLALSNMTVIIEEFRPIFHRYLFFTLKPFTVYKKPNVFKKKRFEGK